MMYKEAWHLSLQAIFNTVLLIVNTQINIHYSSGFVNRFKKTGIKDVEVIIHAGVCYSVNEKPGSLNSRSVTHPNVLYCKLLGKGNAATLLHLVLNST